MTRAPFVLASLLAQAECAACELDEPLDDAGSEESSGALPTTDGGGETDPFGTTDTPIETSTGDTTGDATTGGPPTTGVDSSSDTGDPPSATPGDFDGDGILDFVVYTSYSLQTFFSRAIVFPGSLGTVTADDALQVHDGGFEGTGNASVCNVDGQGPPEVVFGGNYEGQDALSIFEADGTVTIVPTDGPFFRVRCDDFDGDGLDDVVMGAYGFNPSSVVGTQVIYGADLELGTDQPLPQTPVGVAGFSTTQIFTGRLEGGTPHLVTVEPGMPNPSGVPGAGAVTMYDISGAEPVEIGVIFGATEEENFGNNVQVCDVDGDGTDEITEITDTSIRVWNAVDGTSDAPDASASLPFTATYGGCEPQRGYLVVSTGSMTGFYQLDGSDLSTITEDDTLQVVELYDGEYAETGLGDVVKIDVDIDGGTATWETVVTFSDVDGDTVADQVLPEPR